MLTRMAPLLTRMARMARMLTRMTRWLAYYTYSGPHVAPKENSLKKIYRSEFLQSSFIFVIYLLQSNQVKRSRR